MPPPTHCADVVLDILTQPLTPSELYASLPIWAEPRAIRVLDLDPTTPAEQTPSPKSAADDRSEEPLSGTLRVVSLAKSPKFTALSYVWGEGSSAENTISLRTAAEGGAVSTLQLTPNCYTALIHLRQRYGSITVWVDSICINQEDQQEKSNQIPLMKEIFTWASPVYVWLGEGNVRSDKAMDYLSKVSPYEIDLDTIEYLLYPAGSLWDCIAGKFRYWRRICVRSWMCIGRGLLSIFCIRRSRALDADISGSFDMTCLEDLLDSRARPWSQRVWTLQEFLLAWDVVFLCGHKAVHRNDFVRGLKYIKDLEQRESFTMIQSLPDCFQDWFSLLDLWIGCERPTAWNGQQKRYGPSYIQNVLHQYSRQSDSVFSFETIEPDRLLKAHVINCVVNLAILQFLLTFLIIGHAGWYWHGLDLPFVYNALHSLGYIYDGTTLSTWPRPSRFASMAWFRSKRESEQRPTEPLSALNGVMQATRHRNASDPKDKSYAMYGVLESLGVSMSTPDYRKAPGKVYQEFFSDLLAWSGECLRLLMDVRSDNRHQFEQTPTWVPSLHGSTPRWLDSRYYIGENHSSATLTTSHVKAPSEGPCLKVTVQWHGEVSSCSGPLSCSEDDNKASKEFHQPLAKLLHWFFNLRLKTPSTPAYASISDAVFPVLEARTREKGSAGYEFNEWYRTMMDLVSTYGPSQYDDPEVLNDALDRIKANQWAQEYFEQRCKSLITAKRNLFITSYGYLGSGTDTMIEGDWIALVLGLPVPMILRWAPDGSDAFTVVGPAFVHGLMEGEEWYGDELHEAILL